MLFCCFSMFDGDPMLFDLTFCRSYVAWGSVRYQMLYFFKENHCFAISVHLGHEFRHGTYLKLKSSIGAFDRLNVRSTALLGCSIMARQGPWTSMDIHRYPKISLDIDRYPWISMDIHGYPCRRVKLANKWHVRSLRETKRHHQDLQN